MPTTTRQGILGQEVVLEVDVRDARGNKTDADSIPQVEILDANDIVRHSLSAVGVTRIQLGRYRYTFSIPTAVSIGIWTDHWKVVVNGFETEAFFNFIVVATQEELGPTEELGGDPIIKYTPEEIHGINILLKELKVRLKNDAKVESTDAYGNIIYVDCSIFTDDELIWFLVMSLQEFNAQPHFTAFTFADPIVYERFCYIIVEGAYIIALAGQALIEKGKEFSINDNSVQFVPSSLSDIMNAELGHFVNRHTEVLKQIKWSIKPHPIGFGGFRILATSPAYSRLRHLRERRII